MVHSRHVRLPEFDKNRRSSEQHALVFDSKTCKYDMILGTNFLSKTGIKLDFDTGNMRYKARERYSFGYSNFRAVYGSQGA